MSDTEKYRVWSDGTAQPADETPYTWMSDDYRIVEAVDEEAASRLVNQPLPRPPGWDTTPAVAISRYSVAVDQDYFWNEDMGTCQKGVKYQLLGRGGLPEYRVYDGDPFWVAHAPLPKRRPGPARSSKKHSGNAN